MLNAVERHETITSMRPARGSENAAIRRIDKAMEKERGRRAILADLNANERKLQAAPESERPQLLKVKRDLQQELERLK